MTGRQSELDHLLDAAETLRAIAARRAGVARFRSDAALTATDRIAVFRGRHDDEPAILTLHLGADRAERARTQKRDLAAIAGHMARGPFRAAPLLAAWPGEGVLITADIAGVPLSEGMGALPARDRDGRIETAGHWLAHLAAPATRRIDFGGRYWVGRAQGWLARAPDRGPARALSTRLEALLPTVAGLPVTQARGHGDFRPATLVQSQGALYGIAMQAPEWVPPVRELARFLVALHLEAPRPGGQLRFGVGAGDMAALLAPLGMLDDPERRRHLPFFIGVDLAERLARTPPADPGADRLRAALLHYLDGDGTPLI